MLGWAYDGPWDELEAQTTAGGFPNELVRVATQRGYATTQSAKEAHRIIAWKEVGETEGTGIVHIAPGCGREDFLLSQGKASGNRALGRVRLFPAGIWHSGGEKRFGNGHDRFHP